MTDYLQKVENLAVLALLGVLAYLGLKWTGTFDGKKEESETPDSNPCTGMSGLPGMLCNLGVWTTGYSYQDDKIPTSHDEHGCTDFQTWCGQLNSCIQVGTTCPSPSRPYTPVYEMDEHGCKKGVETFCDVLDKCLNNEVYSSSFCNIEDGRGESPTRQINDQCYFRGLPVLNVPPGTDCSSAMSVMCDRFGPGVHQGKDWCLMAGE